MGPRIGLSTLLILGSIVLLVSIAIGNNMGNHVLGQIAAREPLAVPTPLPSISPDAQDQGSLVLGVRHNVITAPTDPAFPDPRITPEPPPPETPRPTARPTRPPPPSPSPSPTGEDKAPYTSPPLPLPIVSHDPSEMSDPNGEPLPAASATPAEGDGSAHPSPKAS